MVLLIATVSAILLTLVFGTAGSLSCAAASPVDSVADNAPEPPRAAPGKES